jgi:hypothetical protein
MSKNKDGTKTYTWVVKKSYQQLRCKHKHRRCVNFSEKYQGEKRCFGDYYVLRDVELQPRNNLNVPKMLKAFEYWFGPTRFMKTATN